MNSQAIMPGAYVGPGVLVESGVTIGPNAAVLDSQTGAPTILRQGADIGANATVLGGITVGMKALVRPGSVVTQSVPPLAIVEGNPARIIGYVETSGTQALQPVLPHAPTLTDQLSKVRGVKLQKFKLVPDLRGALSVGEFDREIPFLPKRYFLVFDVPTAETRGEHAHKICHQFLIAVRGSVNVVADDGEQREEFVLNRPDIGLHLPPMTWGIQYNYSADAVLLVFASHYYDAQDYIRDYSDFLSLSGATPAT
jgi:carbonic anhydrase/acetyltransferase-like protein (isoleucine patch superfamily)